MAKGYLTETEIRLRQLTNANLSEAILGQLAVSQSSVASLLNSPLRGPQQILATHYRPNGDRLPPGVNLPPKTIPQSSKR